MELPDNYNATVKMDKNDELRVQVTRPVALDQNNSEVMLAPSLFDVVAVYADPAYEPTFRDVQQFAASSRGQAITAMLADYERAEKVHPAHQPVRAPQGDGACVRQDCHGCVW